MTTTLDVESLRAAEFPWMADKPGFYLNAAGVGPMPARSVGVATQWATLRATPQELPLSLMQDAASVARRQFASLVGADAEEIALMPNTTYGLNLAARALPLRPGVILAFDGEFPSCVYPFQALGERGVSLELIPKRDGLPDEEAMLAAIANRRDVVAVVVSWVQFSNGFVADLERLGSACHSRGIFFVVDGIQGCGVLPLDLHSLPIDIFSSGAQKWLLSPWGTGFVYVRRDLITSLSPHDIGWASMKVSVDYSRLTDYEFDLFDDARRFEVVTIAYQDFATANASTGMLLDLGVINIAGHLRSLGGRIVDWANNRSDVRLVTPADAARRAGIVSFMPEKLQAMDAALNAARVEHSVREGAIRLSPHCYNTEKEVDSVLEIMDRAAA